MVTATEDLEAIADYYRTRLGALRSRSRQKICSGGIMSFFKKFKMSDTASRQADEALYARVFLEAESGQRRDGLWWKSLAKSGGNERLALSWVIGWHEY